MAAIKTVPFGTKSVASCLLGNRSITSLTKDTRFLAIQRKCQHERSLSSLPMAKYVKIFNYS